MLLLFVNFNMMSFFRTHTWTLVYPGVSIPYNNLNLSQGCLKLNCLRSTFFDDRGVYNSSGTIHTGLNTRRAFGKCSLRDDYTLEWLHFGPRRGCAACRRWALGLCWWNSTTVLNHNRGVYNSFWIKHTGLNTRRAFGKCSLRDDFTLEWLHFGPQRGCAACRRWALGLRWWSDPIVLNIRENIHSCETQNCH